MEGALRRSLGSQAQHTHSLEDHTWSIQQSTTTHTKHIHNIHHFTKQFTNTVKHATHKTNRHINRATHNIQGYNITLTTSQVQKAIKQSKNNNSQGPDKLNIRHLKHIGPLGLAFLTSMFKTALNKNIIPHTWKLANIVPVPKPNKDTDKGTSYRPISLLSVIAKTLEKSLLPYITANIPNTPMQHGETLTTSQVQKAIKQSKNNNSQGPDKLNIRHLKHIGPLGLAFLTSMFKTALNKNIIPHTWKLANIVPVPKPNKDTDKGTSYRPISLLSVIADTGKEPSSLHNSKHTKHAHATRVQNTTFYSDGTTHTK